MLKDILKYLRLMKSIGVTNIRMISYELGNDKTHDYIFDIAECGGWLRKNNMLRSYLK